MAKKQPKRVAVKAAKEPVKKMAKPKAKKVRALVRGKVVAHDVKGKKKHVWVVS
jgi:hypothetical protein